MQTIKCTVNSPHSRGKKMQQQKKKGETRKCKDEKQYVNAEHERD